MYIFYSPYKSERSSYQSSSIDNIYIFSDWLTAARALELVGMLLIVLAIVVAGVHLMCMTDIPMLAILGAFIILVAGGI